MRFTTPARSAEPNQDGSLTAFLVLLAVAVFVLAGLVIDGDRAIALHRQLSDTAEEAARFGADQLSVDALREGTVEVDPQAAVVAASSYLASLGLVGSVTVAGNDVTVQLSARSETDVLSMVGIRWISVSAEATATDVSGIGTGQA